MRKIRCCLATLNQTPLDWNGNRSRLKLAMDQAEAQGAHFLCTPELSLTGYGCEDYFLRSDTCIRALEFLLELASYKPGLACAIGLPMRISDRTFNCLAILQDGRISGIVPKTHLAREGIHYEPRWFHGWEPQKVMQLDVNGSVVPVGNLTFNLDGYLFGLEICEDAWVPDELRPCQFHSERRHAVFNASASHFSFGKTKQRDQILLHTSQTFGLDYYYTNLLGCESGRAIYDGEMMVAHEGAIIQLSPRLGFEEVGTLIHESIYEPMDQEAHVVLRKNPSRTPRLEAPSLKRSFPEKDDEFAAAASLGMFDYMRKSRSRGFTISLSGGVDSAVCAILAAITSQRMIPLLQSDDPRVAYLKINPESAQAEMITTVYQSTRNSGELTRRAAKELALHLGTRHFEFDVDHLVEAYKDLVGGAIGRDLNWTQDDLVLQNIQARSRGPSVWMLANLNGSLLLTTSNRSEVAVGYATMDGDTCGGLAPIAGVEKTYLRKWLHKLEHEGIDLFTPISCLQLINKQAPTAELRPPEKHQSDEADLMPYEVLDALEEALILNRETPIQAFHNLRNIFSSQWNSDQIKSWMIRFLRMFAISQWKRERYAPSFHLDDRSLDPKTWARFPILSGNFEQEIEELKGLVLLDEEHGGQTRRTALPKRL